MSIDPTPESVAIIGLSGRFPQAATIDEFWRNLREGREAVERFEPGESEWLSIEREPDPNDHRIVRARAALERPEWFDAAFFQMNPREAAIMDPQQRVFLECAWEALENAGCDAPSFGGSIGVFAGSGFNTYLLSNLLTNGPLLDDFGLFAALTLNDKDYLATRVAYKLDLRGPAINVQTACSTSLVAVALACQNLLAYQCDVALAGGVSIPFPVNRGYLHVEGGIMSADGHCRAFDAAATGTVPGAGAGVVVLKRLSEALNDGDRIRAVIKGCAINNDGHMKIGYTAPAIEGQAECIALAQTMAAVDPSTISYIEAHGTGTPLGDPIEIAALRKAFGPAAGRPGFCAVGSLKSNIGHLDAAAGVAGLIKTTLALEHGEIPPSLHFENANPALELAGSAFHINNRLRPWTRGSTPRRAGVSCFGIGGTNAHVVVEEAPPQAPGRPNTGEPQLLVLSARTASALDAATRNLAAHLRRHPSLNLADVAYTLQTGRRHFEHRRACVVTGIGDAVSVLESREKERVTDGTGGDGKVVFLFSGQGAQTIDMARELCETDASFRETIDQGCRLLHDRLGIDLRAALFSAHGAGQPRGASQPKPRSALCMTPEPLDLSSPLVQTRTSQPALFLIEYALAERWRRWGVLPAAMIGHSLGEYVAACVAGVFSFEDGLMLVAERARLIAELPRGAMLAVLLPERQARELLVPGLSLAASNSRFINVLSGPFELIEGVERELSRRAVACRHVATTHAFHSTMMEPASAGLEKLLRGIPLRPPTLPWVSNLTGTWITQEQAVSPAYWNAHLRGTVRFAEGISELVHSGYQLLLEVGPGNSLASLARQHPDAGPAGCRITSTLDPERTPVGDVASMLAALGFLWTGNCTPEWRNGVHGGERHCVTELPTYPFERTRCWIEPGSTTLPLATGAPRDRRSGRAASPESAGPHPRIPTVGEIMDVLRELTDVEESDLASHRFAELGFDSLLLAQVATALTQRFGVPVALRQLNSELGSVAELSAHLEGRFRERSDSLKLEVCTRRRNADALL